MPDIIKDTRYLRTKEAAHYVGLSARTLDIAMRMRSDDATQATALFKRRGAREFADEAEQAAEAEREKVRAAFRQRSDAK